MSVARINELPSLGSGLGYRDLFLTDLFRERGAVDFLEIVADHFLAPTAEKSRELDLLAANFPLIPHGLDLSLGSAEGIDVHYLDLLGELIDRVKPPWWSEHIAFTRAGGIEIGHLAPLPFTREAIDALCRNVATVQERISVPLILENITYSVALPDGELEEAQFLTEIVNRTGCGLLLDVANLHINSVNHRYDPRRFLDALPVDRIVQLHFVGGHSENGALIDSHSQATSEEVWNLLDEILARAPVKGVILERDENLPAFSELANELQRARDIGKRCGRWT